MGHVLVADDEPGIRRLLAVKLRAAGHAVSEVGDGDAALAAIREDPPVLAVLDLHMPGRSGIEVCRELQRDPGLRAVRVVLLSGRCSPADVDTALAAGARAFLTKPFDPDELVAELCSHVTGPTAVGS